MAHVEKYVCDICGAERQEANHWFVTIPPDQGDGLMLFCAWPLNSTNTHSMHICGQVCAHKLLDQFLSGELK